MDIRNLDRQRLFVAEVDLKNPPPVVRSPADSARGGPTEVYLTWDRAVDDEGHLRGCPICGCRELFVRKDFPQVTGFVVVALAVVVSIALYGAGQVWASLAVLAAMVLLDFVIFFFTGRTLVCYRCRSEFRDLPIRRDHPGWDLSIGEKYRRLPTDSARHAAPAPSPEPRAPDAAPTAPR